MSDHKLREKSNSITHLVKVVAKEVFEENKKVFLQVLPSNYIREAEERFKGIESRLTYQENIHPHQMKDHEIKDVKLDAYRAGESWDSEEWNKLCMEIEFCLEMIAKKHGRTPYAIKAAIQKRKLI